jgi:hypothetical protein
MSGVKLNASVSYNEAFAARVTARLKEKGKALKANRAFVGIPAEEATTSKTDYAGNPSKVSVIDVALAHEFGTDVLPERSWFRSWFDQNANRLKIEMTAAKRAEYSGEEDAVERQAVKWALDLRAWVADGQAGLAPLDDRTVRARGKAGLPSGPPLFATGQLVNSIRALLDGKDVGP